MYYIYRLNKYNNSVSDTLYIKYFIFKTQHNQFNVLKVNK